MIKRILKRFEIFGELGFVRVRQEPTIDSDQLGEVIPGELYVYSDIQYGWYYLEYQIDEWGWVSEAYIREVN